jgi:hypothetical protein
MVYGRPMDDAQEKDKKLIGKGELVGLICDPRKEVSKPKEK